ncbi:hypothetical protein ACJJTC_007228 [Scirpophaga incertulas]
MQLRGATQPRGSRRPTTESCSETRRVRLLSAALSGADVRAGGRAAWQTPGRHPPPSPPGLFSPTPIVPRSRPGRVPRSAESIFPFHPGPPHRATSPTVARKLPEPSYASHKTFLQKILTYCKRRREVPTADAESALATELYVYTFFL